MFLRCYVLKGGYKGAQVYTGVFQVSFGTNATLSLHTECISHAYAYDSSIWSPSPFFSFSAVLLTPSKKALTASPPPSGMAPPLI